MWHFRELEVFFWLSDFYLEDLIFPKMIFETIKVQ